MAIIAKMVLCINTNEGEYVLKCSNVFELKKSGVSFSNIVHVHQSVKQQIAWCGLTQML